MGNSTTGDPHARRLVTLFFLSFISPFKSPHHAHPPQIFKAASKKFSASTPNIAMVIPVMDSIDDKLLAIARDRNHHPAIRIATLKAKNLLNKYYALTDASNIYRIAIRKSDMLFFTSLSSDCSQPPLELHPWFRGRYFELRKWPIEWRRAARLAR